jgi:nucleotide-binding universal stress UspA family protein
MMALTDDSTNSRFQHHISFDNFASGEPTEKNTISFTLNVKHKGYQFKRRSRTFMVGIDENDYSDIALQWMLEELVDDGDEIVCLRVVDKDAKVVSDRNVERRQYQKEAKDLMQRIQDRNDDNRAISIVLEFAVGKVHATFQKMVSYTSSRRTRTGQGLANMLNLQIQIYEPAMLIVGTRGRSLGGFQGLVSNRNSFSKWCLQYSPVPVVVVRPTEKRLKKKKKRDADPTRQDYARILKESGIDEHETQSGSQNSIFEASNDPKEEAHAVAAALGLPAQFDPTLKPLHKESSRSLRKVESGQNAVTTASQGSLSPDSRPNSPEVLMKSPKSSQLESPAMSGEESSEGEDEEEGEFEAVDARALVNNGSQIPEIEKKKKLHEMEVGEAQALFSGRKNSIASVDSTGSLPGGVAVDKEEDDEEE